MQPSFRRTGRPGGLTMDGLSNVISGVGGARDKRSFDTYTLNPVNIAEVESAYRSSWLVRKIHDLPPWDMTRAWRNWQAEGDQIEAIEAEERRLALSAKVRKALLWARLYGGAALVLGLPGKAAEPAGQVGKGGLSYIHVLTRHQVQIEDIERDPLSPLFGQPVSYQLTGSTRQANVHPSRVIPFIGQALPEGVVGVQTQETFWGDPLYQIVRDAVTNADLAQNATASLIHEAKVDTLKIPNLSSNLSSAEYETRLISRLNTANLAKSILNTRILDAAEEWDTRELSFTGLPDLIDKFLQIVAAAADIPVTRLLGTSAKGLNATGEGDNDNYDEMIAARQETDLKPALDRLDAFLVPSALGSTPASVHYRFAALETPDPKEEADIQHKHAETAKLYADSGLVPLPALAKAVQNTLIEGAVYPGLEKALEDTAAKVGLPIEMFKALLAAWQAGAAPQEALFTRLSEAGLLPKGMSFDAFRTAIEEEGGGMGGMNEPEGEDAPEVPGEEAGPQAAAAIADAEPRTLYVSREVLNASEIIAWAKSQGFTTTVPADELHVTVAYSRAPVDWMKVEEDWSATKEGNLTVSAGGPRMVEALGDKGAVVLMFASSALAWRHMTIRKAGATWDYPEYQPHVTITYSGADLDLATVEPYRGVIELGPEMFEELNEAWSEGLAEQ